MSSKSSENAIDPGDSVEMSITHQIKIGRESAWIKTGIITKVREGESGEQASKRASDFVNKQVMEAIMDTVKAVDEMERM